jgi:hypothetical protein
MKARELAAATSEQSTADASPRRQDRASFARDRLLFILDDVERRERTE